MPKVVDDQSTLFSGKRWLVLATLFFLIDQVSKWIVVSNIQFHQFKSIMPGLQLTVSYNRGVAFSWFHNQPQWSTWIMIAAIVGISAMIGAWLLRTPPSQKWEGISLSLIFGGAMGNLLDRLCRGHVIDFIDFYYQQYHWYTFNLADAFITIGALMLLKEVFKRGEVCQTQNP